MSWGYLAAIVSTQIKQTLIIYKSQTFRGPIISIVSSFFFADLCDNEASRGISLTSFIVLAYVNYSLNFLRKATVPILKSVLSLIQSTNIFQELICQALCFFLPAVMMVII